MCGKHDLIKVTVDSSVCMRIEDVFVHTLEVELEYA